MNEYDLKQEDLGLQESLAKKVVHGGFWVFSLRIAERILDFIRIPILARLLLPSDFGLLGIALLVTGILGTFTGIGFMSALIQKKEKIGQYLDTAWTAQLIRGLLIFCILFFGAPLAAKFFKTPAANWVIKVLAVTQLLDGFRNIGVLYFKKELEFHKQFIYSFGTSLAGLIVSVSCAFLLRSVWALVYGLLAGNIVAVILSYVIHPYRPRIDLDIHKAKELFGFGKWVLSSGIATFFTTHGDDIFVGRVLGAASLGFYQMVYAISNLPATEIAHIISPVVFPAYSRMQDNLPRLRESYLRVLRLIASLSFPATAILFVLAPDFTRVFLGAKWLPAVPALQILVFAGLARSIMVITSPVFYALARPKMETRWQFVRFLVMAISIYPCILLWGLKGASYSVLLSSILAALGFMKIVCDLTKIRFQVFCREIIFPFISGILTIIVIHFTKRLFVSIGVLELTALAIVGALTTLNLTFLFHKLFNYEGLLSMRGILIHMKETQGL
jgi:lipopolysaccharide exporter